MYPIEDSWTNRGQKIASEMLVCRFIDRHPVGEFAHSPVDDIYDVATSYPKRALEPFESSKGRSGIARPYNAGADNEIRDAER